MAIIRSKIARQLLAEGGAPRKGYYMGGGMFGSGEEEMQATMEAASSGGRSNPSGFGNDPGGDSDNITFTSPPALGAGENPVVTYDTGPGRTTRNAMKVFSFLQDPFFGLFANKAINNEFAREQALANARLSGSFMTPSQLPMRMTRTNKNRFNNEDDSSDNIVLPILPQVPKLPSDIESEQSDMAEYIASIRGANPTAFDISERFRLAEGGEPRQNYGLGKLVKKVTGAVKKVAKSDLGKAALIGAAAFGIPGTQMGGIFGRASFGGFAPGVFNLGGIGNLFAAGALNPAAQKAIGTKTGIGAVETIVGASLLGGLLTSKQPEQDINALSQRISDQTGIDVSKIRGEVQQAYQNKDTSSLAQKYPFLVNQEYSASFAKGGRTGFAEGTPKDEVIEERGLPTLKTMPEFKGDEVKPADMMMASAVGDESDDIAMQLFGKPVKDLNPAEMQELQDEIDRLMNKFRSQKPREGIMMAGYGYNEAMSDTFDLYNDMKKNGLIPPTMTFDEFLQEVVPEMSRKQGIERTMAAEGGMMDLGGNEMDLRGGGFVPIGAREKADDVPARLSKNEFVFTADAVRAAGGGSVDRGADLMYKTMKQLENKVV